MKRTNEYIQEKVIDMLKKTALSQCEIARKIGLSYTTIRNIQNEAIENGLLDEKYKRIPTKQNSLRQALDEMLNDYTQGGAK